MQEQQHWESAEHHSPQVEAERHASPNRSENRDVVVDTGDDYLTIHAAARQAGVTRAAVLSWIRKGYIEARTSPNGWLIRSGDIELARNAADDARFGFRTESYDLELDMGVPQDVEQVDERTTAIVSKAAMAHTSPQPFSENVFAPLAEFVRDQADVVQEQAETIGFLQAELRRARMQLHDTHTPSALHEDAEDADDQSDDDHNNEVVEESSSIVEEPDPFGDLWEQSLSLDRSVETDINLDAIADDPSSDEAERVRVLIEETERKIYDLWDDQQQSQSRHASARSEQDDLPWFKRLGFSWKR